jgi:hypothetical protein
MRACMITPGAHEPGGAATVKRPARPRGVWFGRTDTSIACTLLSAGHLEIASLSAPMASAGQCILSGGMPSSALIRSSNLRSRPSEIGRPTIISVSIDPDAIVGPQPTV